MLKKTKNLTMILIIFILAAHQLSCARMRSKSVVLSYIDFKNELESLKKISVCFEDSGFDLEKYTVKNAVTKEFAKVGFDFFGWSLCSGSESVVVQFQKNSSLSQTSKIAENGKTTQFHVNFGLAHECALGVAYSGSNCQANISIHEFGHILGLHHEMNRRDNPICDQEQKEQSGDRSAVQIGDFDESSIMNYCALSSSAYKNEYRGLSEGDKAAISHIHDFPMASLSEFVPRVLDRKDFKVHLIGSPSLNYRFAIGIFGEIDCKIESLYTEVDDKLNIIDSSFFNDLPSGRTLRLCLLAGKSNGLGQPVDAYSSIDFAFFDFNDKEPPALSSVLLEKHPDRKNYLKLTLVAQDKSEIANVTAEFSYMDFAFQPKIPYIKPVIGDKLNSEYLEIPMNLFVAKGTVYLQRLTLSDRNGNLRVFQVDRSNMMLAAEIPSPTIEIQGKYSYEQNPPSISNLKFDASNFPKIKSIFLTIDATEQSLIKNINVFLVNVATNKVKLISTSKIVNIIPGDNRYVAEFDLSSWIDSGEFRVQSISLYDSFDNQKKLKSSTISQLKFDDSALEVPSFSVGKD